MPITKEYVDLVGSYQAFIWMYTFLIMIGFIGIYITINYWRKKK